MRQNVKFRWGLGRIPKHTQFGPPSGGGNMLMYATDPARRKAAWTFMTWMSDAPQAARWSIASGYLATNIASWDRPEMQALIKEHPEVVVTKEQLPDAKKEPSSPKFPAGARHIELADQGRARQQGAAGIGDQAGRRERQRRHGPINGRRRADAVRHREGARQCGCSARARYRSTGRRVLCPCRTVRLRQDDVIARGSRARRSRCGQHFARRHRHHLSAGRSAQRCHGVSGLCALSAHDGAQ